jgi:hypothetical protein
MLPSLSVIRADTSAILFVIATEGTAGVDQFVIRWEEAEHRAALDDGRHTYFIGRDGPDPIGFAIVRDWASPERVAAVRRPSRSRPRPRAADRRGRRRVQANECLARLARRLS